MNLASYFVKRRGVANFRRAHVYRFKHLLLKSEGSATQQNCVRDYVIFTILSKVTPGLHQVCTKITHICN